MDRGPDERVALALGQPRDLRESAERKHPLTDRVLKVTRRNRLRIQFSFNSAGTGSPDRGVAHDLMQPAPEMLHLGSGAQRRERAQERLLHDVLRTSVGTETPRQRMKLSSIALNDRYERPIVARASETDQTRIRLRAEKRRLRAKESHVLGTS